MHPVNKSIVKQNLKIRLNVHNIVVIIIITKNASTCVQKTLNLHFIFVLMRKFTDKILRNFKQVYRINYFRDKHFHGHNYYVIVI